MVGLGIDRRSQPVWIGSLDRLRRDRENARMKASSEQVEPISPESDSPLPGLGARALSGALWTSAGESVGFFLHWAVFVIMARILNAEDFGIFALALVVVGLGKLFGEMGLAPSIVQKSGLRDTHIRTAF